MNQSNDNQQIFKASGGAKHSVGTASKKKFAAGSKKPPVPDKKSPSSSRSLLIQHQDSSQLLM
jgi:hypothetical protein